MHSAPGRNQKPRELTVIMDIVRNRTSAQNVRVVVVASEEAVRAEVERLDHAVGRDIRSEDRFQASPLLAILVPWLDFLGHDAVHREEKWRGEVRPHRVPGEVRQMHSVPRCIEPVPGKGIARRQALFDDSSVRRLDRYAVRFERRPPTGLTEGRMRCPFAMEGNAHVHVADNTRLMFQIPEDASSPEMCRDVRELLPAFETTVCVKRQLNETVHCLHRPELDYSGKRRGDLLDDGMGSRPQARGMVGHATSNTIVQ